VRTCLGCRNRAPAAELVRLTAQADGTVRVGGPSEGRGAWVGPGPGCFAAARAKLPGALRVAASALGLTAADWNDVLAGIGRNAEAPAWCPKAAGPGHHGSTGEPVDANRIVRG
jgi:hypothetical protein